MPAHVGISIYDPSTKQYLYNYQGDKYFIPASNMKLFTCYAAMKNLGDSLVGLRYLIADKATAVFFQPTGDPTFLHSDFKSQPVVDFLKKDTSLFKILVPAKNNFNQFGRGWAWDDYLSGYMAERSSFPIYGNVIRLAVNNKRLLMVPKLPMEYGGNNDYSEWFANKADSYSYTRNRSSNKILWDTSNTKFTKDEIPFITSYSTSIDFLKDTIQGLKMGLGKSSPTLTNVIYSQPTDSLLKITMHRSDNFFAEQTLLMVSNEKLGVMNDRAIIDTLLSTDFKSLPQKPKWVDGSGLSRYNLITPQDFIWVLSKMKEEFKWERIATILPTGNEGTLAGLYKNYAGKIYAKTGTLSNHVALSGYITTNKGRQLIFSILVNNHQTSASNIRRTIEKFLIELMETN